MSKNIVIFSDGTGQVGGSGTNTNVYKLFNVIENRSPRQVSFYDPGLGTLERWRILSQGSGLGFSKNVLDCYRFIFDHYQTGDKLFFFGFSRGAATVRSLSGFIHLFGILPNSRSDLIEQAYDIYKISNLNKRRSKASDFLARHHTMWTKIQFLGVFDTVAALGLISKPINRLLNRFPKLKHDYHDFTLSPSVVHARHALSVDDDRKAFHPVLWDKHLIEGQTMKQVWFAGVHTDVGGGYKESGLSDISYSWMLKEAKDKGLLIYTEDFCAIAPNPKGTIHEERYVFWRIPYTRKLRSWPTSSHGPPSVHRSVPARQANMRGQTGYNPWILQEPYSIED